LEYDSDDPIPVESCYWGFWNRFAEEHMRLWNRFAEEHMRLARLFGFIALLIALGLPQPAKAQNTGFGVVCDTPDQVRRYVLAENAPAAQAVINAEKAQSCAVMNVSFYVGSIRRNDRDQGRRLDDHPRSDYRHHHAWRHPAGTAETAMDCNRCCE
jgi:hypothetical protein